MKINKFNESNESNEFDEANKEEIYYILYGKQTHNLFGKLYPAANIKIEELSEGTLESCVHFYNLYSKYNGVKTIAKVVKKVEVLSQEEIDLAISEKKYNL